MGSARDLSPTAGGVGARKSRRHWVFALALYGAGAAWVWRRAFLGDILVGRDQYRLFIPLDTFLLRWLKEGVLPLWFPLMRLGQPFVGMMYTRVFYPPQWLALCFGALRAETVGIFLHSVLGALGMYACARALRRGRVAACASGFLFAFAPLMTLACVESNLVEALAWTGWILWAACGVERRRAPLALALGLSLLAGAPETSLWQAGLAVLCALAWGGARAGGKALAAVAWAVALAAVQLVPGAELSWLSTRAHGVEHALDWSLSWPQLLAAWIPGADLPRTGGWEADQWFLFSTFLGSLTVALALCARPSRRTFPLFGGGAALALLALGAHFAPAAWALRLWPLSLFRYPAKYFPGALACAALLAAFGLERLSLKKRQPVLWALLGLCGAGLAARAAFRGGAHFLWAAAALALALGATHFIRGPLRPRKVQLALAALACAEVVLAGSVFERPQWLSAARMGQPSALAPLLPAEGRLSVVYDDADQASDAEVEARLGRSRDELMPLRYVEEGRTGVEGYGAPEPKWADDFFAYGDRGALDLAGTTAYLRRGGAPYPDLTPGPTLGPARAYLSRTAFPRAFVAHRARVTSDREALTQLSVRSPELATTALLAEGEPLDAACEGGQATWREPSPDRLAVEVSTCGPAYLVVADAFFPGWTARVDGAPAALHRADHALRAIQVPEGSHQVELAYRPRSFRVGLVLTLIALAALLGRTLKPGRPSAWKMVFFGS